MASDDRKRQASGTWQVVNLADDIAVAGAWQEQRDHVRLETGGIPWLQSARIKYGSHVHVLDVSAGGILFLSDQDIEKGSRIALELVGPMGTVRPVATVRRCRLIPCGDLVRFQVACVFKDRLQLSSLR
jgi:hypothetical protein